MIETVKMLMDKIESLRKQVKAIGETEIPMLFTKCFADNPMLRTIGFKSYTPYYCDGGSCSRYIETSRDDLLINDKTSEWQEGEDEEQFAALEKARDEVYAAICQIDFDTYMIDFYPDNSIIQFNKDGTVEIIDYTDHD